MSFDGDVVINDAGIIIYDGHVNDVDASVNSFDDIVVINDGRVVTYDGAVMMLMTPS